MQSIITIECPPEILIGLHMDAERFSELMKLKTAIALFKDGKLSSGMASRWLGMHRVRFLMLAMEDGAALLEDSEEEFSRETSLL